MTCIDQVRYVQVPKIKALSNYCISTVSTVQCPFELAASSCSCGSSRWSWKSDIGDHWRSLDITGCPCHNRHNQNQTRTKPVHFTGQQMRISKNWNPMTQKTSTLYPNMVNIHQQHNHSFSRGNLANLPFSPDELRILWCPSRQFPPRSARPIIGVKSVKDWDFKKNKMGSIQIPKKYHILII